MRLLFLFSFLSIFSQCQWEKSPQDQASNALEEMKLLVEEADSLGVSFDKNQWAMTDSLFALYLEESSREDGRYLSEEQKKELGKLTGRYATLRIQKSAEFIEDRLKEAGLWMEGFFEGVKEQLEEME
jgi:hypothetical protein